jgi:hypothetical protein
MEVHKRKVVGNWRELLKEWGIIVLGVLTALLAEQAVQSLEWHNKVQAAVADMDNELSRGDGPQSYARLTMHDCIATRLNNLRAAIERGDRSDSRRLIDAFWLPKRTYDSLARESATASDVASHMPHQRMLQYRIAYEMIPDMQRLADKELADSAHLRALPASGGPIETSEKLTENDAIEALQIDNDAMTREARFVLIRLGMMDLRLDRYFVANNVARARAEYGGCLSSPNLPTSVFAPVD